MARLKRSSLSIVLACSLTVPVLGETPFPRPPQLQGRVEFWKRVFAVYDTHQVVVHDRVDPSVVYGVEELGKDGWARRQAAQEEILARYRHALGRFAESPADTNRLSAEEWRVWQAHGCSRNPERYRQAMENLRVQVGQRSRFMQGLTHWQVYRKEMERIFRERGLPDSLTVLPFIESAFNVRARSKAGAVGLWQITKPASKNLLRVDRHTDERQDPLKATAAAAQILKANHQGLGNWPLAITAYNHGKAGVARGVKEVGSDDIVELIHRYRGRAFGFASQNFYVEFLAALEVIGQHPLFYGEEELRPAEGGEELAAGEAPCIAQLEPNLPNPFNSATVLRYQLTSPRFVQLDIYNVRGQRVRTLVSQAQEPGSFQVTWDGTNEQGSPVGTGLYLARLRAGGLVAFRKLLLVR